MTDEKERPYSDQEVLKKVQDEYAEHQRIDAMYEENKKLSVEMQNVKYKMQKREMDRISKLQNILEEEDILNKTFEKEDMLKSIEDRKNAITFINDDISLDFIIAPGSLVAMPSMTNNGKSTMVATISEALVNEDKRVLILSNEETEEDVRARISCLRKKISFGDYKTNQCTNEQIQTVLNDAHFLAATKRLIVISPKNEAEAHRVTTVDGMITTLKSVNKKIDCAIIDYYNNVNVSETGAVEPWHVNNRLASELNIIKGSMSYPMIVMAQCQGIKTDKKDERKENLDFEGNHPMYRWKGGQNLLVYATDVIELCRDFANSNSVLFAHKVRFSHGGMERMHVLPFDKKMQRFIEWTPEWDAQVSASRATKRSQEQGKELGLDTIFQEKNNG